MAPSLSSSVLPTTHSALNHLDCVHPKPSSLFGPSTSSKLVKSFTIIDSLEKDSLKYSIESLLAIKQDAVTMTDRTRVLASQKAEHRKNLADYTKQRAARKDLSRKKAEEAHAATTQTSTPSITPSAGSSKIQKPVYNKYSSLKASKRPRQIQESQAPKAVHESDWRQMRRPQSTRPAYPTYPGLKASKRPLPGDGSLEPGEIRETKRRKTDANAHVRERKIVASPHDNIPAPKSSLKDQTAENVIKTSEKGTTKGARSAPSRGLREVGLEVAETPLINYKNYNSGKSRPSLISVLNHAENKTQISGLRHASPKSNGRKRPAEDADEGNKAASPKRVKVDHELSSEVAISHAPADVPAAKGETGSTSPGSKQQDRTTSGSGDTTKGCQSGRPAGLSNFLFACYSNSALQALTCIPEIAIIIAAVEGGRVQAADDYFAERQAHLDEDTKAAKSSRQTLRNLLDDKQDSVKVAAYLGEALKRIREAEEAGETTSAILFNQACGILLKDLSVLDGPEDGTPFNGERQMEAAGFIDALLTQVKKELELEGVDGNPIDEQIGTEVTQRLRCNECGYDTSRPTGEEVNMIKVEIKGNNGGVEDLLANYSTPEVVPDFRCGGCQKEGAVIRSCHLTKTSPYLLVHINRTHPDGKITTDVPFPVAPISVDVNGTQRSYTALNVIEHRSMGEGKSSMESGHYLCCRLVDDQWWSCDDDLVKKLTVSQAAHKHKQACFVLLKQSAQP